MFAEHTWLGGQEADTAHHKRSRGSASWHRAEADSGRVCMYINESRAQENITAGRVVALSTICVAFLVFYSWALLRGLIQPLLLANLLSRCLRLLRRCTAASSGRSSLTRLIYNAIGLHCLRLRCHLSLFPVVQMPFVSTPALRDLSATSNFLTRRFPLQNLYSVCIALIVRDIFTSILFVVLSACCPPSAFHLGTR